MLLIQAWRCVARPEPWPSSLGGRRVSVRPRYFFFRAAESAISLKGKVFSSAACYCVLELVRSLLALFTFSFSFLCFLSLFLSFMNEIRATGQGTPRHASSLPLPPNKKRASLSFIIIIIYFFHIILSFPSYISSIATGQCTSRGASPSPLYSPQLKTSKVFSYSTAASSCLEAAGVTSLGSGVSRP